MAIGAINKMRQASILLLLLLSPQAAAAAAAAVARAAVAITPGRAGAPRLQMPMAAADTEATEQRRATRVRVSHILVDTEDMAATAVQSIEDGMAFEKAAEMLSSCDSKGTGGDLGWISPGLMVPEFDLAAFNFAPGTLATVKSEFGWHVLRVAEASYVEPEMSPMELKQRLAEASTEPPTLQLIDLRDDEEIAQAPLLPGFRHLPYLKWQTWAVEAIEGTLSPPLDPALETVFMDHRGGRGERLMQYLSQNGFGSARFVHGGINAYAEEADPSVPTYLESDGDCLTCKEH